MPVFERRQQSLFCEDLALSQLADHYQTPLYVYSRKAFSESYLAYANALGDHPGQICYAVKANSNIAVLQVLAELGAGFDIVSKGELQRVIKAGGDVKKVIFSGVGKTADELLFALEQGIGCFNVESEAELQLLSEVASSNDFTANISLRVNPDVDAQTHPYISTGLKENKFGIDIQSAPEVYARADKLPGLNIIGVDCHIGSQLVETQPFFDALDRLLLLLDKLAEFNINIEHLDLGGGIGVCYKDEVPPNIQDYIGAIKTRLGERKLALYFEPGRSIAANSGVLLTEVLFLKPTEHKNFAIVDAAMNDNIRPSLYQAWQDVQPLEQSKATSTQWDLVGPICETGDFLAKDRTLALEAGERLALMSSGAYGFVMSSNYNSRGRAAEVMVDGDQHYLVRERENFDDLVRGEALIPSGAK
ncbi:diaminopimelate decarboxylase [Agaribacterium sp. ZY112]|uniref:diaminopimelate decarboxylase n=1 Tax=Agaribacterium sp. ZY112 TaxID=3233574 RepID=UPI00352600EE